MNVIIKINGREAIPVRAIPFLTDWEMMFPDALVDALAGEGIRNAFAELVAHRRNGDVLKVLTARWWANHIKPEMNALQDRIRAGQISDDDGYADWKPGALEVLPEGVFVWKDSYVDMHTRHQARTGVNVSLDFCPDIPPMFESLVASGFVDLLTDTAPATSIKAPEPVSDAVESDNCGPAPLTRKEIANCFAGLRGWDVERWKAELSSPDDWLKACQQRKGTRGRGGFESTWWPVCIACAMVDRQDTTVKWVSARFKNQEPLKPWLDTWQTYHPDNA